MNIPQKTLSLFAGASLLVFSSLSAVTTDPVGYVTQTVPAHDGTGATLSLHSLPLKPSTTFSGSTSDVTGAVLTVSGTDFSSGYPDLAAVDANSKPLYYVETSDGLRVDITSVGTSDLTLSEDVEAAIADVTSISIKKYWTIEDVFGAASSSDLSASSGITDVDKVLVADGSGSFEQYYIYQAPVFLGGGVSWAQVGEPTTVDKSTARIPEGTLLMVRVGSTTRAAFTFTNAGTVKLGADKSPVYQGINLVSFAYPVDTTLGTSGLQEAGLTAGSTVISADKVLVTENGSFKQYYLYEAPAFLGGGISWAEVGQPSSSDKSGDTLSGAVLVIRGDAGDINWTQSQPFTL
jgi:hypothetical protein